ncbi:MAG: ComEC/Rec2 family competence protein [Fimbriimonadales bacterium]|nr:ComEC/Rec2 family competence protein [Fimbriimonadales bacterium]
MSRRHLWLSFALMLMGFSRALFAPTPGPELAPGHYEVTGYVSETPNLRLRSQSFVLRSESRSILVTARSSQWLMAGDYVQVTGNVAPIKGESIRYWEKRGVSQSMYVVFGGSVELLEPGKGLGAIGSEWRTSTWNRLLRHLPKERAGLAMGIVAGQQGLVSQSVHQNMKRAGTMHLLATSGFNVLLIAGVLMFLLSHLPIPRTVQCILAIVLLVIYCFAVGSKPPVLRATVMAGSFFAIQALKRTPDTLSLLGLAALLFSMYEPAAVFDAGFQLSFVAVASLILFVPSANRWIVSKTSRIRNRTMQIATRWIAVALIVTVIAQLGSAPILAAHFGQVSLIAPIANLLTATAVPFVYLGVGLGQLFSYVSEPLSHGFDFSLAGSACAWIDWINATLASPHWAAVELRPIPAWAAAAGVGGLFAVSRPYRIRKEEMSDEDIL